jgi:hypothetical protein
VADEQKATDEQADEQAPEQADEQAPEQADEQGEGKLMDAPNQQVVGQPPPWVEGTGGKPGKLGEETAVEEPAEPKKRGPGRPRKEERAG